MSPMHDATSVSIDAIKQHDHYKQIQSWSTSRNKVTVLVHYNILCDIFKAVTLYGPNPVRFDKILVLLNLLSKLSC